MGAELAALSGFFGLTGFFATVGAVLMGWMAWRIVEKAGLPGWVGLGSVLLTLTGIGSIVPLILLWVFAYMRWPRDAPAAATTAVTFSAPGPAADPTTPMALPRSAPAAAALPSPAPPTPQALGDGRLWQLSGPLPGGQALVLAFHPASGNYLLTGAAANGPTELSVPDASVGRPHARVLTAGSRLGLEDLGTPGGTWVDGARLAPEHGPRDISLARRLKFGAVEFSLTRG
jgi:hypothetical protein